ncbi:MAG: bifunctional UDP-3-O-[3-hydroxymyristoyl] N-acetylglucosamine deacetylase/3-hydroxyacyl-ACP dehydratase [Flavobacteriales bacterium]|nr:bifunctional UDP-3-O-[3-hydroxymyristoyl] N-acetylglucosamine deacetylase/3-hydroxyacyl-ACP dehydratase [Flavobacteriales bacterium]
MEKQKTIKKSIQFSGKGIHTGSFTNMTLLPAQENKGIVFIRTDKNDFEIKADIDFVVSTDRSTNLAIKDIHVKTVEHILSAVSGNNIDNLIIEIDNEEIPILDGSAKEFSEKISAVGLVEQNSYKKTYKINKEIRYFDKETGSEIIAMPSENFQLDVTIDYNSKTLGVQNSTLNNISDFSKEIASSRTFCFLHELEQLLDKNLIKGGDINNAIVVVENDINNSNISNLAKQFGKDTIKVSEEGVLDNLELRYKNEASRHKLLDVIGDLSLVGFSIKGKITAKKPGHTHNTSFAKKLKDIIIKDMKTTSPIVNFDEKPIYNKEEIKEILPHRDPFLFIDEVRDLGDDFIVGIKFVKKEEDYFKGHFPGSPVMPGVLQLETMAQVGGVLILSTVEDPQNYLTYFMKIDNAKFKQKVIPGDIIIFRLELISPIRRGLCHMHGTGFVDGKIVVEADLLAKIAHK